jgi:hypothetical protein
VEEVKMRLLQSRSPANLIFNNVARMSTTQPESARCARLILFRSTRAVYAELNNIKPWKQHFCYKKMQVCDVVVFPSK